jgi:hypothetical protein
VRIGLAEGLSHFHGALDLQGGHKGDGARAPD